ncbi:hypothetical protein SAMN05444275_105278 [Myroides odoratimimus subsp. xuanwuensis]|nr:hypothetical protein SAMN05444275_105278 [Myroides odoratimimus subsp. xuanwuensis]
MLKFCIQQWINQVNGKAMKKYSKKISAYLSTLLLLSFLVLGSNLGYAQVVKDFKPRESPKAPMPYTNVKNYNLQGDFLMFGNTNMTLQSYNLGSDNSNNQMNYVNVDRTNVNIVNSSSADLVLPGGECTEIIYAGIYWSGRTHNGGNSAEEFTVNKNNRSYTLNKRKAKIKFNNENYVNVTAAPQDIYYPSNKHDNMYSAYADITYYVRDRGAGTYTLANLALIEGNGGSTGFYGGWGMVIIYKNTAMKWRDITVFDGHAYVARGIYNYELPISGFKATQHGDVNVTLGMMAGEGDRNIPGDYFEIKRGNNFDRLNHSGNKTNNFFNSSIEVGGTTRNPNLVNNTGFDIAKFDLNNAGNKYIGNNATSATFRYGSTQDTYVIYNIVFAVDAYVPDVVGENKATNYGGVKPLNNGTITPGQEFEFELDVYNKGTEAVNNSKIEIPVPFNLHFLDAEIVPGLDASGSVTWVPPTGGTNDPSVTAGGKIVWDIGNLPLDTTKEKLLAQLKYRFRVSDNCVLLSTNVCGLEVKINGKISGEGATSKSKVNSDLVRDYGNGVCAGPVYDDFISKISVTTDFLQNCNPPVEDGIMQFKAFCSVPTTGFDRSEIINIYPPGAKFYSKVPTSYTSNDGLVTGDFSVNSDGSRKMYYVMVPDMEDGCYARLEISIEKVTTSPIAKNTELCFGEPLVLENELSATGKDKGYELVYFDSNQVELSDVPSPTAVGTYKYFVAEGKDGCIGPKKEFTIVINALPEVSKDIDNIVICENFDSAKVSITTNVSNYKWEYTTTGTTNWKELDNTTFSNRIILEGKTIKVSHASKELNGLRIRLNVTNNQCSDTSNEFEIKVNDCSAVTNPMLLNQAVAN